MRHGRLRCFAIAAAAALISGCGSSPQKLCEADISSKLINPETAEYFDFLQVDEAKFREGFENMIWREKNVLPQDRYKYGDLFKGRIDKAMAKVRLTNPEFYSVRVKADSRMGLNITSQYVCGRTKESDTTTKSCICIDALQ